jgi:integrase
MPSQSDRNVLRNTRPATRSVAGGSGDLGSAGASKDAAAVRTDVELSAGALDVYQRLLNPHRDTVALGWRPADASDRGPRGPRSYLAECGPRLWIPMTSFAYSVRRIIAKRPPETDDPDFPPALLDAHATPDGFVLLFDAELKPIDPANSYLFEQFYQPQVGDRWQNTQRAMADDLSAWWMFLSSIGLEWDRIIHDDVRAYAARLKEKVSLKTRSRLSASTLKRRIGTVLDFYYWARHPHFIEGVRGKNGKQIARSASHYVNSSERDLVGRLAEREQAAGERIRPLSVEEIERLGSALGQMTAGSDRGAQCRDRLIFEAALQSGMRIGEVCNLTVSQIQTAIAELDPDDPLDLGRILIVVTKGRASRWVYIPRAVLMAIEEYIFTERAEVIRICRTRYNRYTDVLHEPNALFLNGEEANGRDIGRRITTDNISRRFAKAQERISMLTTREIVVLDADGTIASSDHLTKVSERLVPAHTFHDLRHTFAINFYAAALRVGYVEPWKIVQARLGHKRMKTTKDVYLNHLRFAEHKISDIYLEFVRRLGTRQP